MNSVEKSNRTFEKNRGSMFYRCKTWKHGTEFTSLYNLIQNLEIEITTELNNLK